MNTPMRQKVKAIRGKLGVSTPQATPKLSKAERLAQLQEKTKSFNARKGAPKGSPKATPKRSPIASAKKSPKRAPIAVASESEEESEEAVEEEQEEDEAEEEEAEDEEDAGGESDRDEGAVSGEEEAGSSEDEGEGADPELMAAVEDQTPSLLQLTAKFKAHTKELRGKVASLLERAEKGNTGRGLGYLEVTAFTCSSLATATWGSVGE